MDLTRRSLKALMVKTSDYLINANSVSKRDRRGRGRKMRKEKSGDKVKTNITRLNAITLGVAGRLILEGTAKI